MDTQTNPAIGVVVKAQGNPSVTSGESSHSLKVGDVIYLNDKIRTASDDSLQVLMGDGRLIDKSGSGSEELNHIGVDGLGYCHSVAAIDTIQNALQQGVSAENISEAISFNIPLHQILPNHYHQVYYVPWGHTGEVTSGFPTGPIESQFPPLENDELLGPLPVSPASVSLPIEHPPVALDDVYETREDTALVIPAAGILSNDADPDGDPLKTFLVRSPQHGSVALDPNGGFIYTPNENYNGPDSFTYKANDGGADSNEATVNINVTPVNDPPVAVNDSYTTAEDTVLTIPAAGILANDSDIEGDVLSSILVTGPSHGTLTLNSNGGFVYTPNANYNGPDSFTYKANDGGADSNVATVNINVTPVNDPPVAVNDSYTTAEDTVLTIPAAGILTNDSDIDGDVLSSILVTGPAHGTLTLGSDGAFVYTPNANYNGPDSFTYKNNDGSLNSNIATVNINVTPVNDPPVAVNDSYTTAEDTVLTIPAAGILVNDSDIEGDVLSSILVTGPSHGTLTLNSNGGFVYTPNANYNGPDSFTYKANDGGADSNVATVNINVTPVNDPPVAVNDSYTTAEDTVLTIPAAGILTNDSDIDGDVLSSILVTGPAHGTLTLGSNGSFVYTPNANYNGPDKFTYKNNDGSLNSNVATVNINITPVNDPPVAVNDSYTTAEDTVLTIPGPGILVNDFDIEGGHLTSILVTGPSHGTLTLGSNGSFVYTPNANYNGPDSFTYKDSDGSLNSNIATVNINVTPVNDPPVAVNDSYTTAEDTVLTIPAAGILTNDSDIDGDVLSSILVTGPAHGTLTLGSNGSFVYTPNANYNGPDSFTYKNNDGSLNSNIATVNINVTPVNDLPTADQTSNTLDEAALSTGTNSSSTNEIVTGNIIYNFGGDGPNVATPFTFGTGVLASDPEAGDPALGVLKSGGVTITWSLSPDGLTLTGSANSNAVIKVELLNVTTGNYKVTLLGKIDNPDINQSGSNDPVLLKVPFTVKDANGDAASGFLNVTVKDDAPIAHSGSVTGNDAAILQTNLMIVLDVSGSMGTSDTGLQGLSRLDVAKASVKELLEQYDALGNVAVRIVTFSTSASSNSGGWLSVADAKNFIDGLSAGGSTNYDAALSSAQTAFPTSTGKLTGAGVNNVSYFLSDGEPNLPSGSAGINATEQTAWETFLDTNNIKSFAFGMGTGIPASAVSQLDPIAYNGVDNTNIPAAIVSDFSQLTQTLTSTLPPAISGNILTSTSSVIGADTGGNVLLSYTVNSITHNTSGSITTALGGVLTVDLLTGNYTYQPPANLSSNITENIGFTIRDADNDTSSSIFTINVINTDQPPIVRDDNVITNITGNGATIAIPDYALLYNDTDADGNPITISSVANASSGTVSHAAVTTSFADNNTSGGSFDYTGVANSQSDTAHVNVDRSQAGDSTLDGTGLSDVLIGRDGSNDTLRGYEGNDVLISGSGNGPTGGDTLIGGKGNDLIDTAKGNDIVKYNTVLDGTDKIVNFDGNPSGGQDVLDLTALFDSLGISGAANRASKVQVVNTAPGVVDVNVATTATPGVFDLHVATIHTADPVTVSQDIVVGGV